MSDDAEEKLQRYQLTIHELNDRIRTDSMVISSLGEELSKLKSLKTNEVYK
jgi:CII-binding regulator of phage lambda lysogenization HflD